MIEKMRVISVKIPEEVYNEMLLRIPEGERSSFIREAIIEKIQKIPKPAKILELEQRLRKLENEYSQIRKKLVDLDMLTFKREKVNPHNFCIDEVDKQIVDYLIHYKGATTSEIAEFLKVNRWLVLNRLKRLQKKSGEQLGEAIVEYHSIEKYGKKRAWWINEDII